MWWTCGSGRIELNITKSRAAMYLTAPYSYGYGSQFEDTARELIMAHFGWTQPERREAGLQATLAVHGYWADVQVLDVDRKRDM